MACFLSTRGLKHRNTAVSMSSLLWSTRRPTQLGAKSSLALNVARGSVGLTQPISNTSCILNCKGSIGFRSGQCNACLSKTFLSNSSRHACHAEILCYSTFGQTQIWTARGPLGRTVTRSRCVTDLNVKIDFTLHYSVLGPGISGSGCSAIVAVTPGTWDIFFISKISSRRAPIAASDLSAFARAASALYSESIGCSYVETLSTAW